MPREKDIAWKFVIELEDKKWRCPHCEIQYSGQVTRVKSHFLKHPNKGIYPCKKVPEHISTLMDCLLNQVCNKDDIAWKFVNRLEDNKWICHYCSEEFIGDLTRVKGHLLVVPNDGISICTEVPDHARKLMRSLLNEVAEEESREANRQFATETPLPLFSPEFLEYRERLDFNQQDVIGLNSDQQSQAERRFHQSSEMPLSVQNSHDIFDLLNHTLGAAHGNEIASSLQPLSMDSPALSSLIPSELPLLDQPTHLETGNEPQNSRGLSQYDQVLGEQFADGITTDSSDWSNLFNSLPESRDVNVNTSEDIQMNELDNPKVGSSLQNGSSLDVDSTNRLPDGQPCLVAVVPVLSPTNTVQHPEHTLGEADSRIIKATIVDSQVPEASTNTTGPSSSQGDCFHVLAEQLARFCEVRRRDRPDLGSDVWRGLERMRSSCGGLSSFRMNSEERCRPPSYFICPILQEVMQDPQVAADGFTYEAEALREWLRDHDTSPMTNLQLEHKNLVPNRALRSAIQEWSQNH